jgi:hypothetical protein
MKSSNGLLAAALLLAAVPAMAQQTTTQTSGTPSLSELAKRAQEKKGTPPPTKTFTNDDLKTVNAPPSEDQGKSGDKKSADAKDAKDGSKAEDAKSGDAATADEAKKNEAAKVDPSKTEKYWRDRMDAAREDIRRNQAFAAALQSRINGLSADFAARDDPYQRAQIADDRQKALAELERVNKAIEEGNKAIASIEEEARKAMVPAGWNR